MKQILKFIVYIAVIGFFAYIFRVSLQNQLGLILSNIQPTYVPCSKPIDYTLGTFDTRFGISKENFLGALKEAEAVWEKLIGREFFSYAPDGNLKVNLIYDYRQEATSKLKSLGLTVDVNRNSYDALNAKYTELNAQYEEAKANYDSQVLLFNAKNDAYNQQVTYWNSQGGAPKKEYNNLLSEKKAIQTELAELKTLEAKINEYVNNIKSVVVVLNNVANDLNIDVREYNNIGTTRDAEFEEGLYKSDGLGNNEIDIYEFNDHAQLVRVLAHELGHALDLSHVDDKNAIMYKLNTSKNQLPTLSDITELKTRCGIK